MKKFLNKKTAIIAVSLILIIAIITAVAVLRNRNLDPSNEASNNQNSVATGLFFFSENFDSRDSLKNYKITNPSFVNVNDDFQLECYTGKVLTKAESGNNSRTCGKDNLVLLPTTNNQIPLVEKNFNNLKNSVVSLKYFDDGTANNEAVVAVSDNSGRNVRFETQIGKPNYVITIDNKVYDSGIVRSRSWKLVDFFVTDSGSYLKVDKAEFTAVPKSNLNTLVALKIFNTTRNKGQIRVDNIMVNNSYKPSMNADMRLESSPATLKVQPITIKTLTGSAHTFGTSKFEGKFDMQKGTFALNDKSTTRTISGSSAGAFFDWDSVLTNFTLKTSGQNELLYTTTKNGKTYDLSFKFTNTAALINLKSTSDIRPIFRFQPNEFVYGLGEIQKGNNGNLFISKGFHEERFVTGWVGQKYESDSRNKLPLLFSPQDRVGYALFDGRVKYIHYNNDFLGMGVSQPVKQVEQGMALFTGKDVKDLYANYHQIRKEMGYEVITPKYDHLGIGYEIYGDFGCEGDGLKVMDRVEALEKMGVKITWITLGSGWWSGSNLLGCLASNTFNKRQDPTTDSLAFNSRYTTRYAKYGNKNFFEWAASKNIKVMGGMRTNISVGNTKLIEEALKNDYLMKNADGTLVSVFQSGVGTNLVLLDTAKPNAVKWYYNKIKSAYPQFSGWKEDLMIPGYLANNLYLSDNKAWPMIVEYSKNGYMQRCRNSYFTYACDMQLIQDLWYSVGVEFAEPSPKAHMANAVSKELLLSLQHTISGHYGPTTEIGNMVQGRVVGLQTNLAENKTIFKRHMVLSTFTPGMDFSAPMWTSTDATVKGDMVYYTQLHQRLQRYLYDAMVESANTGFPYSMTPLVLNYPTDPAVYNLGSYRGANANGDDAAAQAEFMVGKGILVAPVLGMGSKRNVYLPEGTWYDLFTGQKYTGKRTISYDINGTGLKGIKTLYPVFIKAGEPIILPGSLTEKWQQRTRIYPISNYSTVYNHYDTKQNNDGSMKKISGTITVDIKGTVKENWAVTDFKVIEKGTNKEVQTEKSEKGELSFNIEDGKSYQVGLK